MLERASASAGSGATPDEVAKHYLSPALARHFADVTSTSFLMLLAEAATIRASLTPPQPSVPDSGARAIVQTANKYFRTTELMWGWLAVVVMSLLLGFFIGPLGFAIPFIGPGFIAYIFGSHCGRSFFQGSSAFAQAVSVAQATLAYERTKTDYWQRLHWRDLELEVAALFQRMGYTARATPASNDKGVDVIAERLNEKIVVQCKQYAKDAQRNLVSELLGVMKSESASRGILICTGGFTRGAEDYAAANGVELWDLDDVATHHERNA